MVVCQLLGFLWFCMIEVNKLAFKRRGSEVSQVTTSKPGPVWLHVRTQTRVLEGLLVHPRTSTRSSPGVGTADEILKRSPHFNTSPIIFHSVP